MLINLKQTLAYITLLLVMSGCQSGAGSSSWKWWGAQKDQSVSPSELAGSPYDGVALPSAQVEPPKVTNGQTAPKKKTLATIPPGTPTPDAYSVTGAPKKKSGTPTYPSTAYPSTPYTNPQSTAAGGVANAPVPSAPTPGTVGPENPRYPVTEFAAGNPQPRYPNTGYSATPVAPPNNAPPRVQAGQGLAAENYGDKPTATGNPGFSPDGSAMGPRYSFNSSNGNTFTGGTPPTPQTVVPPVNTKFPGNSSSPTQNTIGPRYATLPKNPVASRYDARPAPPTNVPYDSANPGFGGQEIVHQPAGRYPQAQAILPTTHDSAGSRQVDFTPYQPGSTGRYEPESTAVTPPPTVGGNTYQPGTPYNPPATERP
ncbi:MAG: hypothetical protein P8M53_06240 [Pirellulales bacterium]|nr:hypothetical protein [Pirellulales bacterium]